MPVAGLTGGRLHEPPGLGLPLLLAAPAADQWLLVRTAAAGRITALSNLARQFDPGGRGTGAAPHPADWCCRR